MSVEQIERPTVLRAELVDIEDDERVVAIFNRKTKASPYSIEGDIQIVTAWNATDSVPYQTSYFANVFAKWDGCSHFYFYGGDYDNDKEKDSYYHICGIPDYIQHMRMYVFIYEVMVEHVGYEKILEKEELDELRALKIINDKYKIRYFYDKKEK